MRSVELFTGCGGLGLGLARAGFHHDLMVEWNGDAVATVLHNKALGVEHVADWPIVRSDVREIDWKQFAGVDLVAGGPPCQPFSIGGKHRGDDDHRDMWPQAIRSVREIRPRAFLFENVRGLTRRKFAGYLQSIIDGLAKPAADLSYEVRVISVNAADFGAAQKRHRVIIAGVRSDVLVRPVAMLQPTHSRDRLLWEQFVTGTYWREHGLPRQKEPTDYLDISTVKKLRALGVEPTGKRWVTVRDKLRGLGDPTGVGNHVFQAGAKSYKGHTGSPLDQPAKALKAGDHGVPGGENMMVLPGGAVRYFTTREAARLQGLPDNYDFPRSWTESMRQLGNAVPSELAEAVGKWMASILTDGGKRLPMAA
ncbi:DNA (cytosine-5-)-methyltransferase [Sphingomonas sp.]|uniref:DNA cytosine methyltransferase n=1 Tax=Sphingomonas sp. TaxID=28214 RepID=UPI002C73CFAF|nr:DNA (cytosine-5-)-methyltransferase [Sphingomonas sp.]HWK36013.1 DNA (cytosine-5-)-methyltransferase [Sphingomonas sp.]